MNDLHGSKDPLSGTDEKALKPGDFPLRSLESRAAARAKAERFPSLPDIISVYVEPLLDAEGKHVYGGQRCDSEVAIVDYGEKHTRYERNEGETLEDFERRVLASHPRGGLSRILTLLPTEAAK
jgi:hypothetical protein